MSHGKFWTWPWTEVEVNLFMDHYLRGGPAPPVVHIVEESESELVCSVDSDLPVEGLYLAYSFSDGPWSQRDWEMQLLDADPEEFHVLLPPERPLAFFVMASVKNERGYKGYFSTPFRIRRGDDSPAVITLDPLEARPEGWVLRGKRPRGVPVVIESSTDFCHWTRLMTNNAPDIEFVWPCDAGLPAGHLTFRARSWEVVR